MGLRNIAQCWYFMQGTWKYQCRKVSRNSGKQPLEGDKALNTN